MSNNAKGYLIVLAAIASVFAFVSCAALGEATGKGEAGRVGGGVVAIAVFWRMSTQLLKE